MATNPDQTIRDSRKAAMSILNSAKAKEGQRGPQNTVPQVDKTAVRRKPNPVDDFLKAAKRKEAHDAVDLAVKVRDMSDEEFENAMKSGEITPEQLRKAGEYDWDVYMGDVWIENPDNEERFNPEPTYDEFIADPEKWGHHRGWNEEQDRAFDRYKRTVKQQ